MSVPSNFETFGGRLYVGTSNWVAVDVPERATLVHAMICGCGGNGGNGFSNTSGTNRAGGGGGGSGGMHKIIMPTFWLPGRKLWLLLGAVGDMSTSYLSVKPNTAAAFCLLQAVTGNAGGNGSGSSVGAGGTAGSATAFTNMVFGNLGGPISFGGQNGSNGGAIAGGNGVTLTWGNGGTIVSGGSGGGGTTSADFSGGAITGVADYAPTIAASPTGSNPGSPGVCNFGPMPFSTGGTGGSSSNTGVGGKGGDGAPGSGGGGGGGGTTGGGGGLGGAAFALISWS